MDLVLKSPNEAPYESGKDYSIVISFDNSTSAANTFDLLRLLKRNLKREEGRLYHQWWQTELLAFDSLREQLAAEAADADMIIIGLHDKRELPEPVEDWLKRMIELRKARPGALVALLHSDSKTPDITKEIISQLKQAAKLGKMDFIATQAVNGSDGEVAGKASKAAQRFITARKTNARLELMDGEGLLAERRGEVMTKPYGRT